MSVNGIILCDSCCGIRMKFIVEEPATEQYSNTFTITQHCYTVMLV